MLQLTRENKNPTIDDTKRVTKLVNQIKSEQKVMILKKEDNLADSKLLVFCDASFANMTVGGSQGGYIVFQFDAFENNCNLIAWQSHRIKGIVNSTLAAEAMAIIEASKKTFWIRYIIIEIFPNIVIPVIFLQNTVSCCKVIKANSR